MPNGKPNENSDDMFIDIDDVQVSPRGRKPELDADLVALLARIPTNKAARLTPVFGTVAKTDRAAVSAKIRKHWRAAHGDDARVRIDYSPQGDPQVRHGKR